MNEELNNKEILHNLPFLTEIKEKDEKINTVYAHAKIEDKNTNVPSLPTKFIPGE
jgi:hypothetical protein